MSSSFRSYADSRAPPLEMQTFTKMSSADFESVSVTAAITLFSEFPISPISEMDQTFHIISLVFLFLLVSLSETLGRGNVSFGWWELPVGGLWENVFRLAFHTSEIWHITYAWNFCYCYSIFCLSCWWLSSTQWLPKPFGKLFLPWSYSSVVKAMRNVKQNYFQVSPKRDLSPDGHKLYSAGGKGVADAQEQEDGMQFMNWIKVNWFETVGYGQ